MNRPSYLLVIVLLLFVALVAIPMVPSVDSGGGVSNAPEPVVLQMEGPPPKGTVELQGRVIDVLGWPLAGAEVRAGRTRSATSDDDGRFRLRVVENESVPLTVAARGGAHGRAPAVLPQEDSVVVVVEPQLPWVEDTEADKKEKEKASLAGEGLVQDEDRRPAAHAVVTVVETGASVKADENGRYRIPLPVPSAEGEVFHLIARDHSGRVIRTKVEHTKQQQGLRPLPTLQVTTGHQVTGFIKDGSGNAASGAGLVLSGQGQVRRVVTGGDGEFGISGLLAGEYELSTLPHKGWVGSKQELAVGSEAQDVELQLRPERPLTIMIQNQAGEPQADVHLVATETGYRSVHGRSDARGRVFLRGLGNGQLTFSAHRGRGQELEILRYDAGERRLTIR
jgi:hypothetical protein